MAVRVLARCIQFVLVMGMFDCADAIALLFQIRDEFRDQSRLAVVLASDNVQSFHDVPFLE